MNPRLTLTMTLLAAALTACDATELSSGATEGGGTGDAAGTTLSVNAGGSAAGSFVADAYFSGGSTYSTTNAIDTSQIAGTVPPQAVFQTERYGEFTYTVPGFTAGSPLTVTLYFQESYWTSAGQRTFNVAVNGATVLSAFDIFASAGGQNRAIARTFNTTANSSGQVVIQFTKGGGPDNPKICGITVVEGSAAGYMLGVNKAGAGAGTVASGPAGISCGSTCTASFASGTTVTLTATAASGSTFSGWSGDCVGTGACTVSMTSARTVTATFDPVVSGTSTSVNAGGAASGSFAADSGFSGGNTYSTTNVIDTSLLPSPVPPQAVLQTERYGEFTYTVPSRAPGTAQTVTLYFVESYWTAAGQRTFNVAVNGAAVLTAFDIYASAGANRAVARTFSTTASASGQVVIQFTKGGGPDNPKVCGITVTGPAGTVTNYTLGVTRSGTGSGTVTGGGIHCGSVCSVSVASGTNVTLTAAAASGSTFTGWSGACGGTASTCAVAMTAARSVTATFGGGGAFNPCPATGDCRILPLGDSITDGFNVAGGYRIELFRIAHAAGKHLTFVGSLVNGPTTVDGVTFPRNHEGHSGWTISQIAGLVPSPALNTPPQIVLVMAGTNDMYGATSGVPASVQRLDALLGKLVSGAPNALIVVAQITPLSDSGREALVRSYNAGLPAIVNARAAQGQHVVLVDMHTNFPLSELADGTHPNTAGYARMAGAWYAAVGSLLR